MMSQKIRKAHIHTMGILLVIVYEIDIERVTNIHNMTRIFTVNSFARTYVSTLLWLFTVLAYLYTDYQHIIFVFVIVRTNYIT